MIQVWGRMKTAPLLLGQQLAPAQSLWSKKAVVLPHGSSPGASRVWTSQKGTWPRAPPTGILCAHSASACLLPRVICRLTNPACIDLDSYFVLGFSTSIFWGGTKKKTKQSFLFKFMIKRRKFATKTHALKEVKDIQEMHRSLFQAGWTVRLS